MVYEYEYDEQTQKMRVNCLGGIYGDSIEDYSACMATTIDKLMELKKVVRIVFAGVREYEYDFSESKMLLEIALAIEQIMKGRHISIKSTVITGCEDDAPDRYKFLQRLLNDLRFDPIEAYKNLMREIRKSRIRAERETGIKKTCYNHYMSNALLPIADILDNCRLIQLAKPQLTEHKDRSLYRKIFHPTIRPNFIYTRYISLPPANSELVERYKVGDTEIEIYSIPGKVRKLYQIIPPEFRLNEFEYTMLDTARRYLGRHEPRESDLEQPERIRENLFRIGLDMLRDLAADHDINEHRLEELASILARYTAGLGILDLILQDENIQDVEINSPIGSSPIYIFHGIYQECETNIVPSMEDAESWATRFRLRSGRPLDEANPVLDTEIEVPGGRARVAAITRTLSPEGLGFAFRRHRDKPWTLPLFINNKMIDSFSAGLLWFLIDGSRTLLIAGTRSSGKCLSGEEMVQLSDGRLASVKGLVENVIKTEKKGEFSADCDIDLISLDNNMKAVNTKCVKVWKRTTDEKMLKITTNSGKELICTENHPIFTYEKGFIEKPAKKFKINDMLASPRFLKINPSIKELQHRIEAFAQSKRTNSVQVKKPENLEDLMEFLGFVYGDGSFSKSKIEFTNNDGFVMSRFIELAHSLFGYKAKVKKTGKGVKYTQIMTKNITRLIHEVFELPYGKKSYLIKLPDFALSLPDEYISKFIRALFDCDCYVPKKSRMVEYTTASKAMAKQVALLFSRFGILSSMRVKRVKGNDYHNIVLYGNEIIKFKHKIGLTDSRKIQRLEELCTRKFIDLTTTDIIPEGGEILKNLRLKLRITPDKIRKNISKDYWAYENSSYNVTRKWFEVYIKYFEEQYEKIKNFDINMLENFVETDFNAINSEIKQLKNLLNVPYSSLSENISEAGVRKVLGSDNESMHLIDSIDTLQKRLDEIQNLEGIKDMVDRRIETYARISKICGLPETSIKGYIYGGIKIPSGREKLLQDTINKIREEYASRLSESNKILENIKILSAFHSNNVSILINIKDILSSARELLNIENEELATSLSLSSVSNFFNNRFESPKISTIKAMAKSVISIYENVVNSETEALLENAKNLASSDILWDRIVRIEELEKRERSVYDLTIDNHHNFIANGVVVHNSSLLGACMVQIMPKLRIITVEDTIELPSAQLRDLGYNIQSMKSRSVITNVDTELPAEEALRTALRLGDSCLIIGEVRSKEALALYEAMRIGALANLVAGTIHGDSAYGVFDRVVNDLGVPPTSFKATDIILIANMLKSPDGLKSFRRCVEMTEVRKHWKNDPMDEGGFVNLLEYSARDDVLKPSKTLLMGESQVLNDIALRVREWKGNWDSVWNNIKLRAKIFQTLVDYSNVNKRPDLLEANNIINSNSHFHIISNDIKEESGTMDSALIYERWLQWLKKNY
ncbi:MAG TPA: ATPase, T2SS/T4P/T4SS family [archaeon]|nr:ATPase, T2SS/T4P/T4SS family [archaeon]